MEDMVMMALALFLAVAQPEVASLQSVSVPQEGFCVDCCNLYCAAAPTLSVSHHLSARDATRYDAAQLGDGYLQTAWVVSNGPGEWFEFSFLPGEGQILEPKIGVSELYFQNGYAKNPAHWRDHARVRRLELQVDGVTRATIALPDQITPQRVSLPQLPLHPNLTLRFVVRSVYPGARFSEAAISEARVDGCGHH
jgi:hypothetical protein